MAKAKQAGAAPSLPPRDRIMQVATELIYQQGYRATGINEVIGKSGVAKATIDIFAN